MRDKLWKGKINKKIVDEALDALTKGGVISDFFAVDPSRSDFVGIVNAVKNKKGTIRVLYAVRSKNDGVFFKSEGILIRRDSGKI